MNINKELVQKFVKGISTRFTSLFSKGKKKNHVHVEHDSEDDDEKEFDKEEYENEVVNPNNSGKSPLAKGFKRKILAILVSTVVLGLFFAHYWESEKTKAPKTIGIQDVVKQEAADASNTAKQQTGRSAPTYQSYQSDVLSAAEINRKKIAEEQKGRAGQMKSAQQAQPGAVPSQSPSGRVINGAQPANIFAQNSVTKQYESAEERELREENERYKAPISFQIGGLSQDSSQGSKQNVAAVANGLSDTIQTTATNQTLAGVSYIAPTDTCLMPGTIIPAMLFSGINTDTPGQITAVIQADVYDTASRSVLLLPAGSQIIGKFENANTANGRVNLVFSTIVLPDGGAYTVGDTMIAVDKQGYGGVEGKVNRHTGRAISGGLLTSAMAALGSMAAGNTNNTSNTYSAGQLAMQGAMANMINASSKLFEKGMNINATTIVPPGYEFDVYVIQPINFSVN